MTQQHRSSLRLVAIIAAYNEEDIIRPALAHLVQQGASIYLLDDGSTDRTIVIAQEFAGKGLIGLESLPRAGAEDGAGRFCWSRILERKAQLAHTLDGEWFIHQDADEFRESPWPHLSLLDAIQLVDRLGWNAIDFEVFNFVPSVDEYRPGDNPAMTFRRYHPAAAYDRLQIRCWKKTNEPVDLVTTGGHEAVFPGRRVFPIRFPMRHYPIRSAAHGERKIFRERRPRFDPEESARGWHVQYDQFVEARPVLLDSASALVYDPEAISVALQVNNRLVAAAGRSVAADEPSTLAEHVTQVEEALVAQRLDAGRASSLAEHLDRQQRENEQLRAERDDAQRRLAEAVAAQLVEADRASSLAEHLDRQQRENEQLRAERDDAQRRLAAAVAAHLVEADRASSLAEHLDRQQDENEALRADRDDGRRRLEEALVAQRAEAGRAKALAEHLHRQQDECEQLRADRDDGRRRLAAAASHAEESAARLEAATLERDRLKHDGASLAWRLEDMYASRSWRITGPLRAAWRLLGGK